MISAIRRQFSYPAARVGRVSKVQFLTSNVNRKIPVNSYTLTTTIVFVTQCKHNLLAWSVSYLMI